MTEVEVEGKTTEDAIEAACRQLGQPREMLEIEVITPGSTGIFGIVGARKARVRARLKETRGKEQGREAAPRAEERRPSRGRRRQRTPRRAQAPTEAAHPSPAAPAEEPEPEPLEAAPSGAEPLETGSLEEPLEAPSAAVPEAELSPPSEELVAAARQVCERIVAGLGYEGVEVRATGLPGEARLELVGEECSALIGRRGDVLNALQHLVSKIANRQTASRVPVTLDVEGWRARRRQALEELALKLARKAKESGRPVAMNPMNAHDRRIVHLALQHDGELKTKSRGEGALRKVVIFPPRRRRNSRKSQGTNRNS
jgi:spoIIIJ-associated protein